MTRWRCTVNRCQQIYESYLPKRCKYCGAHCCARHIHPESAVRIDGMVEWIICTSCAEVRFKPMEFEDVGD